MPDRSHSQRDTTSIRNAELQRIVHAAGADVVGDEIVMGDLVPLLGVVPEPTDILDELPVVVDQQVINGDHPLVAVARVRRFLQSLQPPP